MANTVLNTLVLDPILPTPFDPVLVIDARLTRPAVIRLPPVTLPDTDTLVRVPTEVMLGCAPVVTVPAVVAVVALVAVVADPAVVAAPVNAPTNVVLVTLVRPATVVTVAPSVSAVEPKVTAALASRACASVPVEMLVAEIELTLAPDPCSVPIKLPLVVLPVTAKLVSVPTLVIFD